MKNNNSGSSRFYRAMPLSAIRAFQAAGILGRLMSRNYAPPAAIMKLCMK
jgi:hypothetical protein